MIERIFDNWLTSASERSFQLALVQLLIAEGHEIIHVSTHGAGEHGKDIISKDGDGRYHAYQLKVTDAVDLPKGAWRDMREEVYEVSEVRIEHPSVIPGSEHTGWFVINSGLTPDVSAEIETRNREYRDKGMRELRTILKGEVRTRLLKEFASLLPEEPAEFQQFLSLYLANGNAPLDKAKFAKLVASALPEAGQISKKEERRRIAGATLLSLYALHPYIRQQNHVAVIDGLVIVAASILRWVALRGVQDKTWQDSFTILMDVLDDVFTDLEKEVLAREDVFVEGQPLVDEPYYRYRITKLLGYLAGWQVFRFLRKGQPPNGTAIGHILQAKDSKLLLWGETAVPQFLMLGWFRECIAQAVSGEHLLTLLQAIVEKNDPSSDDGLPSPYYSETQVLETKLMLAPPFDETFVGRSFTLRSVVDVLVRRENREPLSTIWKQLSQIYCVEFTPSKLHDYLAWHVEKGRENARFFEVPQGWTKLKEEADRLHELPKVIDENRFFLPLFLLVYPHRLCPRTAGALDLAVLERIQEKKG